MARGYAAVLGMVAFAILVLRGALRGELAHQALTQGLAAMVVFCGVGYAVGAAADWLIRHTVETEFRARVEHFRQEMDELAARRKPSAAETSEH